MCIYIYIYIVFVHNQANDHLTQDGGVSITAFAAGASRWTSASSNQESPNDTPPREALTISDILSLRGYQQTAGAHVRSQKPTYVSLHTRVGVYSPVLCRELM